MIGTAFSQRLALPASPKIQSRQSRTVERILAESARLFLQRGFDNSSVEDIIQAAEIGRSSFYRFFANREEVLAGITRPVFERGIAFMDGLSGLTPIQIMDGLVDMYLDLWHQSQDALRLSTGMGGPYFRLFKDVHDTYRARLAALVETAAGGDILLNDSGEFTARLIARTAVSVLEIYKADEQFEQLFRRTMRGLLLKPGVTS